jgi:hypothetical protein
MNHSLPDFFSYGSAVPTVSKYIQYGLYNPISDCFVITSDNNNALTTVAKLFSSRYNLILCRLDLAENFESNLVDNSVCLQWTLENASDSRFTVLPQFDAPPVEVKKLIPATTMLKPDDLLICDQLYLLFALDCVNKIENHKEYKELVGYNHSGLVDLVDLPFVPPVSQRMQLRKEIYNIIYKTFEFEQAKHAISTVLDKYDTKQLNIRFCLS